MSVEAREKEIVKHKHEESYLNAMIEKFLLGEGQFQPSWRPVLYLLDDENQAQLVDKIRTFDDSMQDLTFTMENVAQVMELVDYWNSIQILYFNYTPIQSVNVIPESWLKAIQEKCPTKRELANECASHYVHRHPLSSWTHLASCLYSNGEFAAVEKLRPFLPHRDLTVSIKKVNDLFSTLEDEWVENLGILFGLPDSKTCEIHRNYHSPMEVREAYIEVYVNEHPHPTWKQISQILHELGLHIQAAEVESTYVQRLRGVEVCGHTHVIVTNTAQSFEWKGYGMKLHIKENSLPVGTDQITIYIKASIAGHYDPPESYQQVSPIFWFLCEPICKLEKEVILELQHCATPESTSDLSFARAVCSQKDLPYSFKLLNDGGQFSNQGPYGLLRLSKFSGIGTFLKRLVRGNELRRWYFACLYYPISSDPISQEIHVVVTWNTPAHVTEMEARYLRQQAKQGPHNRFHFESDRITLNVPQGGTQENLNGWTIIPLNAPVLMKDEVDEFIPGRGIPCCQLLARTVDQTTTEPLLYTITLNGAKSPNNTFTIYHAKPATEHTSLLLSRFDERDHTSLYLKLLLHADKWRDIGKALGFLEGELKNIESDVKLMTQSPPKSWLREMLSQWLQWAPGDNRGSSGFATKESLRSALLNVDLGQLAQQFS